MSDLCNKQFGKLTVLSFVEKKQYRNWWLCLCSCGKQKIVREDRLIKGTCTSCGCALHKPAKNRLDLTNKRFGKLVVSALDTVKEDKTVWKCRCDCGKEIKAQGKLLVRGTVKSCGCLKHSPSYHRSNYKNKRFGKLTVIDYHSTKKAMAYWRCKCDCGKETIVSTASLQSGTKSCGCLVHTSSKRRLDLTGKKFGKLTVVAYSHTEQRKAFWKCKCDCGNIRYVHASVLVYKDSTKTIKSCEKCAKDSLSSFGEKDVLAFVKSLYKGKVIENDRKLIAPKELDIYIPEKKFAIEYNGVYWHSEAQKVSSTYHLEKTLKCFEQGVRLFHIYDYEWNTKNEICKSMIASALGVYKRKVYARNCQVREVTDKKTVIDFFDKNHIQGAVHTFSLALGLYQGNELLQCCVFGNQHFGRNGDIELYRMVTELNTQVVGGFSKIMNHSPFDTVVSYVALRIFDGKGYLAGNWKIEHRAHPSFCITDGISLFSRHLFKKANCLKKFDNVTEDMSEREMCEKNGFYRLWDCGTYKVRWSRK